MNKKHGVFAFIAMAAIGGAVYFGSVANKASAATAQPKVYVDESSQLTKQEKAAFEAVVVSLKNLQKVSSSETSKIKRFVQIGEYCFIKSGRDYTNVPCP